MDAPLWLHWRKLIGWAIFEGCLIGIGVQVLVFQHNKRDECLRGSVVCELPVGVVVLLAITTALVVAYAITFCWYMYRAFKALKKLPYNEYKMSNILVRVTLRTRLLGFIFFPFAVVVYLFVGFNTCISFFISWLGFTAMQVVSTAMTIANAFMWSPKQPTSNNPIAKEELQTFAWTEQEKPAKLAARQRNALNHKMQMEPMFCYETAIKMFYWSCLVYDVEEARQTPFSRSTAMSLYGLQEEALFWEKELDTKCLLSWSKDVVVLAFRGTASMANVIADVQVWQSQYPEGGGASSCCRSPAVHSGFKKSWLANGLRDKVVAAVYDVVYNKVDTSAVKVYVTGHSLGGALAALAAFDIQQACPCLNCLTVCCYTFGAPRTGNHAFARQFNSCVPDTWHIINDQDVIARGGKFFWLYKRPGQRVIINRLGDMIVRSHYVEILLQRLPSPVGMSVAQHTLVEYQKSLVAVCSAQFSAKGQADGVEGVLSIVEQPYFAGVIRRVLSLAGGGGPTDTTSPPEGAAAGGGGEQKNRWTHGEVLHLRMRALWTAVRHYCTANRGEQHNTSQDNGGAEENVVVETNPEGGTGVGGVDVEHGPIQFEASEDDGGTAFASVVGNFAEAALCDPSNADALCNYIVTKNVEATEKLLHKTYSRLSSEASGKPHPSPSTQSVPDVSSSHGKQTLSN